MNKESTYYKNGFDAGKNGANGVNTHFSNFETAERTKEWEAGQQAGRKAKANAKKATKK